ncbi:MAG: hypothetical protein WC718_04255 [Phycisphaerales bacterium]|jgi:hypothetical protein
MAAKKPTDAQLLRLIRSARGKDPATRGTITTTELAKIAGVRYEPALAMVHDLLDAGKLVPEKCPRRNVHGELQRVKGFRVVA